MPDRPHIIILNPDEMRWDALGHLGNPAARTPRLDAFAAGEAVSFSHAYCQNPVCVPSRCSFTTGLYPHVNGHRTMQHLLHEHETSLFRELRQAGYYVWMNARNDLVAGQVPGLAAQHADEIFYADSSWSLPHGGGAENAFPYSHFAGRLPAGEDSDLADTRAAVQRILHPADGRPLCLFLGWVNPHPPYGVAEPYYSAIDRAQLPPRIRADETHGKSLMLRRLRELSGMGAYPEAGWDELRAAYLGQCAKVDALFGMVCDALREAGIYDDSAIFFLSDHGDFCGDYDLPEKAQNSFEDCLTRVPLLVKPPKGAAVDPGVTDSLAELVDFYATAMDYAGVAPSHDHFGRSLRPVIADRAQAVRQYVHCEGGRMPGEQQCDEYHAEGPAGPAKASPYWPKKVAQLDGEAHEKGAMICDGRYKYVHRPSGRDELYDLAADPGERRNRFGEPGTQEQTARLRLALLDWYQQTCDVVPRAYDSRFTEDRLWAAVRGFCPPEREAEVRAYFRAASPGILEAVRHVRELLE